MRKIQPMSKICKIAKYPSNYYFLKVKKGFKGIVSKMRVLEKKRKTFLKGGGGKKKLTKNGKKV